LVVLSLAAHGCGEPLPQAVQRRSDAQGVYAGDYARGYQPVAYAALSLHSPIPVLHVLSAMPVRDQMGAHSMPRPTYAHPYPYASMNHFVYDSNAEADEPSILYARPNPRGGYSYRRKPVKRRPTRPTEPIIIRVHKYRVIRDR
jgi:hypothetical protein